MFGEFDFGATRTYPELACRVLPLLLYSVLTNRSAKLIPLAATPSHMVACPSG